MNISKPLRSQHTTFWLENDTRASSQGNNNIQGHSILEDSSLETFQCLVRIGFAGYHLSHPGWIYISIK